MTLTKEIKKNHNVSFIKKYESYILFWFFAASLGATFSRIMIKNKIEKERTEMIKYSCYKSNDSVCFEVYSDKLSNNIINKIGETMETEKEFSSEQAVNILYDIFCDCKVGNDPELYAVLNKPATENEVLEASKYFKNFTYDKTNNIYRTGMIENDFGYMQDK